MDVHSHGMSCGHMYAKAFIVLSLLLLTICSLPVYAGQLETFSKQISQLNQKSFTFVLSHVVTGVRMFVGMLTSSPVLTNCGVRSVFIKHIVPLDLQNFNNFWMCDLSFYWSLALWQRIVSFYAVPEDTQLSE